MKAKFLVNVCSIAVTAFCAGSLQAAPPASSSVSQVPPSEQVTRPQAPGGGPGLVWVNTEAGVYHGQRSVFYGTTGKGKYMTEQGAIQAGYKRAPKGR